MIWCGDEVNDLYLFYRKKFFFFNLHILKRKELKRKQEKHNNDNSFFNQTKSINQSNILRCSFWLIYHCIFVFPIFFQGDSPFGKTEAYIKLEQLGEGSYATVFKGYSK